MWYLRCFWKFLSIPCDFLCPSIHQPYVSILSHLFFIYSSVFIIILLIYMCYMLVGCKSLWLVLTVIWNPAQNKISLILRCLTMLWHHNRYQTILVHHQSWAKYNEVASQSSLVGLFGEGSRAFICTCFVCITAQYSHDMFFHYHIIYL